MYMKFILIPPIKDGYVRRMECVFGTLVRTLKPMCFLKDFIHKEKVRLMTKIPTMIFIFFPDKGSLLSLILSMTTFQTFAAGDSSGWE